MIKKEGLTSRYSIERTLRNYFRNHQGQGSSMIWQKTKQWLTYKILKDNVFSRDSFSFLPSSRASRTLKKSLIELNIHVFNDSWGQCVKAWPPPTTTHTNFSQQPDIQLSSNFHSRLMWPRLNDFRTNQEPSPPQIQLLTWRTG